MGRLTLRIAAMLLSAGWAAAQTTQRSWEYNDGGWQQASAPAGATVVQDDTLDRVEEMIQNKQAAAAKRIVVAWLQSHKGSPIWDRGLFLLGQANFGNGDRIMSFYNFEELLEKHPASRYYYPALQREYDIADAYLKGYKDRFLWMAILERNEEATEMLYRIQQRAPGSPLAEKALLRVADFYYADGEFDIAADAYASYIRGYPKSPYLPRVRLRQAFASLAQFRGVKFDATPIIDARQQLEGLMKVYPALADQENIPAILQRIDAALAKKLLVTADFYRRTHKPSAAAFYYRFLMQQYPGSPEAGQAKHELGGLPAATQVRRATTRPASTRPTSPMNQESR